MGEGTVIENVALASSGDNGKTANTENGGYHLMYNDDLALVKSNGGKVSISGAKIIGNAGLALNSVNAETVITGAEIDGNMGCGNKGGIIIANGGTMAISGTSIDGNKAMARSATILGVINGAEVAFGDGSTMNGNKHLGVGDNTAGAMVVLEGASRFVMNGGSISDNAGGRAGAIASRWVGGSYGQHEDTSIILNAGTIAGNTASNDSWSGAAVFLRSPASIGEGMTVDGGIVVNAAPGELEITGGNIDGSLSVADGLSAVITGGSFGYDPAEWLADGYEAPNYGGKYYVMEEDEVDDFWASIYIPPSLPETGCDEDAACNAFNDVDPDAWYHEVIDWAVAEGVLRGYDDGSGDLGPEDATLRTHVAVMMWRMAGEPATAEDPGFKDVRSGAWYYDAVAWARECGLLVGYQDGSNLFGTSDVMTREQMAVTLWRFATMCGIDTSVGEDTNILSYEDFGEISEWAVPAMQWAVGAGIIGGYTDADGEPTGYLGPQDDAERAHFAAMLMRMDSTYEIL